MKRVETFYICDLCKTEDKPDPFWLILPNPPDLKGLDKHLCPECVKQLKEALKYVTFK